MNTSHFSPNNCAAKDGVKKIITETGAGEVWVTHGREEALVHEMTKRGIAARALALVGREDEAE